MRYFEDTKHFRQVLGVLMCLLLLAAAAFSQEKSVSVTEKDAVEKTAEAETRENNSPFQIVKTEADGKEKQLTKNSFDVRFQKGEKNNQSELSDENFVAKRVFSADFSGNSAEIDKRQTRAFSFSESKTTPTENVSNENTEFGDDVQAGQSGDSKKLKIGGHAGFVVPIYGYGNGSYSRFYDDFTFGFPVGLTLKPKGPVAIDFEFIFLSAASPNNRRFVFVIHPGVIYGFKKKYAVGVRAAYEANNNDAYGFTPLVARSFKLTDKLNHFIEFDFPVRWNKRTVRVGNQNFNDRFLSGAWAVHYGVSF